jgi:hypothetical protein
MKFKASQNGGPDQEERGKMAAAAAAEITFGVPVNVEFGNVFADLGVESRGGQRIVVMALDDGDSFLKVDLSPEQAEVLADVLHGLAQIGS